jgi:methylthioribose-1-phosphate isomerase
LEEEMYSIPKKTELEKLSEKMSKLLLKIDKNRTTVLEDGWQTQRHAKKSRNWDYYAQVKFRLIQEIESIEGSDYDKQKAIKGILHLK